MSWSLLSILSFFWVFMSRYAVKQTVSILVGCRLLSYFVLYTQCKKQFVYVKNLHIACTDPVCQEQPMPRSNVVLS